MWYEIERDPMYPMVATSDCMFKKYTLDSNGDLDYWYQGYFWMMMFQYMGVGGKYYCNTGSKSTCEATMENYGK